MIEKKYIFILFFISIFSSNAGATNSCILKKRIKVNGEYFCAYNLSVAFVNDRTSNDLIDETINVVGGFMDIVSGGIFDINGSLRNEISRGSVVMKPTEGYENYKRCGYAHKIVSKNDATVKKPKIYVDKGVWSWSLPRQTLFEGRNWYMAHWAWVSHHPNFKPDVKRCNQLARNSVDEMEINRLEIEESKKLEAPKIPVAPHEDPTHPFHNKTI